MLRVEEVLEQLDASHTAFAFPDLNHGYYYAVDARLHAFRDEDRWALVVETVGYNPRGANLYDVLHVYGNCLTRGKPGFENSDFLARVDNMTDVEDRDNPECYRGNVPIIVRGVPLAVTAPAGEDLWETMRRLVPAHRELLLADEQELRARIPKDLPEVLRLPVPVRSTARSPRSSPPATVRATARRSRQTPIGRTGLIPARCSPPQLPKGPAAVSCARSSHEHRSQGSAIGRGRTGGGSG